MVTSAITEIFDEAVATIRGYERISNEHSYYWSVYLTALQTVAYRAGDTALAARIHDYRTTTLR